MATANRRTYELQAHRIEEVLHAHKITARVCQARVSQRFVRFDLVTTLGTKLSKVNNLAEELAYSLGVRSTRVFRENGVLHIEVPQDTSRKVDLRELSRQLGSIPPCCGVLGIDETSAPLLLKLDSADVAHVLIAGTTGSGKTVLMRTLLLSLAAYNHVGQLQLALIDPKGRGLGPLSNLPHLWRGQQLVSDAEGAIALLGGLVAEMERRDREARDMPRVVVAIDELADLIQSGGKNVAELLQRLTQRGREAGIHVIAATQRPSTTLVGGLLKANFPVRLVGSVASPDDARVAAGIAGCGAERLAGQGDFLLINKGRIVRFQAAHLSASECSEISMRIGRVRQGPFFLTN